MKLLDDYLSRLPARTQKAAGHVGSLVLGFIMAFLLTYVLYRIGLPSKPFIYVAF